MNVNRIILVCLCVSVASCMKTSDHGRSSIAPQTGKTEDGEINMASAQRDVFQSKEVGTINIHNYNEYNEEELVELLKERDDRINQLECDLYDLKQDTNKMKDRKLSNTQIKELISFLKDYEKSEIIFNINMGDLEADKLAKQFQNAFKSAGWTTGFSRSVYSEPVTGIYITIKKKPVPKEAYVVKNALSKIGYMTRFNLKNNKDSEVIELLVGSKP